MEEDTLNAKDELLERTNSLNLEILKIERTPLLLGEEPKTISLEDLNVEYAGASWRINSVWRKPTAYGEELKGHVKVIVHCKSGYHFGKFNAVGSCHEYIGFVSVSGIEFAISDILEYAYLEYLLPDGKEDGK